MCFTFMFFKQDLYIITIENARSISCHAHESWKASWNKNEVGNFIHSNTTNLSTYPPKNPQHILKVLILSVTDDAHSSVSCRMPVLETGSQAKDEQLSAMLERKY